MIPNDRLSPLPAIDAHAHHAHHQQQQASAGRGPADVPPALPHSACPYSYTQPPPRMPPHDAPGSSYAPPDPTVSLPKIGQTRCYWALLSADLHFIYLDPVLASHLEQEADALVGKSLLAFVHPDEQASAEQDLGSVLESRTLHGTVTRVRYCRLSRIRRLLGHQGIGHNWIDADKIALDSDYMAVDIVINWAADGLVLCFIHAVVDLTPDDNDEHHKTGWTNWCGTPYMSAAEISLLFNRLLVCIPHQPGNMSRVFQILANRRTDRTLLLSWPPDHPPSSIHAAPPQGSDFAKLVEDVQIGSGTPSGGDAKTSCTRRYKAFQQMPPAFGYDVESIFIPHGTVIFACYKITSRPPPAATTTTTSNMQQQQQQQQQMGYGTAGNYHPQQQPSPQQYYDQPSPYTQQQQNYNYLQQQGQMAPSSYTSQPPPPPWQQGVSNIRSGSYPSPTQSQWQGSPYLDAAPPPAPPLPPLPPPTTTTTTTTGGGAQSMQHTFRSDSPSYSYGSTSQQQAIPPSTTDTGHSPTSSPDVVPPPRRRVSPGSTRDHHYPLGGGTGAGTGGGGRSVGNRPAGVLMCSSCKATSSPEWRKGPSGKKELCNACGLRYARSRAKKETQTSLSRKRKDTNSTNSTNKGGITKRDSSATPPTPVSSYGGSSRRSLDESVSAASPFSMHTTSGPSSASSPTAEYSTSTNANANANTSSPTSHHLHHSQHPHPHTHPSHHHPHPHPHPHTLSSLDTPSPSPPGISTGGSNLNFVHYSPQDDNTRSIYSTTHPSPLSNPPVMSHPTHPHTPSLQPQQLQLSEHTYSSGGRMHGHQHHQHQHHQQQPQHHHQQQHHPQQQHPTSPISPQGGMQPMASYERDHNRDRDYPSLHHHHDSSSDSLRQSGRRPIITTQ